MGFLAALSSPESEVSVDKKDVVEMEMTEKVKFETTGGEKRSRGQLS